MTNWRRPSTPAAGPSSIYRRAPSRSARSPTSSRLTRPRSPAGTGTGCGSSASVTRTASRSRTSSASSITSHGSLTGSGFPSIRARWPPPAEARRCSIRHPGAPPAPRRSSRRPVDRPPIPGSDHTPAPARLQLLALRTRCSAALAPTDRCRSAVSRPPPATRRTLQSAGSAAGCRPNRPRTDQPRFRSCSHPGGTHCRAEVQPPACKASRRRGCVGTQCTHRS